MPIQHAPYVIQTSDASVIYVTRALWDYIVETADELAAFVGASVYPPFVPLNRLATVTVTYGSFLLVTETGGLLKCVRMQAFGRSFIFSATSWRLFAIKICLAAGVKHGVTALYDITFTNSKSTLGEGRVPGYVDLFLSLFPWTDYPIRTRVISIATFGIDYVLFKRVFGHHLHEVARLTRGNETLVRWLIRFRGAAPTVFTWTRLQRILDLNWTYADQWAKVTYNIALNFEAQNWWTARFRRWLSPRWRLVRDAWVSSGLPRQLPWRVPPVEILVAQQIFPVAELAPIGPRRPLVWSTTAQFRPTTPSGVVEPFYSVEETQLQGHWRRAASYPDYAARNSQLIAETERIVADQYRARTAAAQEAGRPGMTLEEFRAAYLPAPPSSAVPPVPQSFLSRSFSGSLSVLRSAATAGFRAAGSWTVAFAMQARQGLLTYAEGTELTAGQWEMMRRGGMTNFAQLRMAEQRQSRLNQLYSIFSFRRSIGEPLTASEREYLVENVMNDRVFSGFLIGTRLLARAYENTLRNRSNRLIVVTRTAATAFVLLASAAHDLFQNTIQYVPAPSPPIPRGPVLQNDINWSIGNQFDFFAQLQEMQNSLANEQQALTGQAQPQNNAVGLLSPVAAVTLAQQQRRNSRGRFLRESPPFVSLIPNMAARFNRALDWAISHLQQAISPTGPLAKQSGGAPTGGHRLQAEPGGTGRQFWLYRGRDRDLMLQLLRDLEAIILRDQLAASGKKTLKISTREAILPESVPGLPRALLILVQALQYDLRLAHKRGSPGEIFLVEE